MSECGFCKGKPVGNAATWVDGKPRPPAPCPRCGETNLPPVADLDATVRAAHSAAMQALGADVHPYTMHSIEAHEKEMDIALDALASRLAEAEAARDTWEKSWNELSDEYEQWPPLMEAAEARIAALEEALGEAIHNIIHMEMPDTGVIGPQGEREKDHHEALLYSDIQRWRALLPDMKFRVIE